MLKIHVAVSPLPAESPFLVGALHVWIFHGKLDQLRHLFCCFPIFRTAPASGCSSSARPCRWNWTRCAWSIWNCNRPTRSWRRSLTKWRSKRRKRRNNSRISWASRQGSTHGTKHRCNVFMLVAWHSLKMGTWLCNIIFYNGIIEILVWGCPKMTHFATIYCMVIRKRGTWFSEQRDFVGKLA